MPPDLDVLVKGAGQISERKLPQVPQALMQSPGYRCGLPWSARSERGHQVSLALV